ncbi:hypothetical protein K2173_020133 [Erythroxylum novogranatense]|uniref:Glycosyltransferase n=1 Tax=Erythroxylum novogranatense TaxID=1862640 RepID=A0AAV8UAF1_9ROSI|nr:hypothetical protein K2173_020133 [Erythroxylum novogranatense]
MGSKSNSCDYESHYHALIFPFMAKGHLIPLLQLARLLLCRRFAITVITTPANRPFIAKSLEDTTVSIIELPFPQSIPRIPSGVESTDKLPSMSLLPEFARSTKAMQPEFEHVVATLEPVNFMVSDGFLWWTLESANKLGFPRLVFFPMSNYASSVSKAVSQERLLFGPESDNEPITVPEFPWIKITRNDFDPAFADPNPKGIHIEFVMDSVVAAVQSFGILVNGFYELEPTFADYINRDGDSKSWNVGPLCLAEPPPRLDQSRKKPAWIQWLDQKLKQGHSVLYIAFGSQAELSTEQLRDIATGLEGSEVNFMWVIREDASELGDGFEERVKERGIVVRDWVDQTEILKHECVQGFLSHCGWNSVLESICAGVPILAWPMMADQPLNARMVLEEIKVGLRVETCNGSVKGYVKSKGLKKMVRELMEGERGKEVRKKVKEFAEMAKKAMEEEMGSSWLSLNKLIDQICNEKKT